MGQLSHRVWMLKVHTSVEPFAVILRNGTDTTVIPKASSVPTVECARRFVYFYFISLILAASCLCRT
eukprot:COSAG06_NODE_18511_length_884_cov_0.937580_1_plen_67_part_00